MQKTRSCKFINSTLFYLKLIIRHCLVFTRNVVRTGSSSEKESPIARQIRDIHYDMRSSARIIKDSRLRLLELQKVGDKALSVMQYHVLTTQRYHYRIITTVINDVGKRDI